MTDAKTLIINALEQSETIVPSGKNSLLGIASRALKPDVHLSKKGISVTLGLHPGLVVSILVTADIAGDTLSRREMGQTLFQKIKLHAHIPELTDSGRLAVSIWCLERLQPISELLDGILDQALALARRGLAAEAADAALQQALDDLEKKSKNLQRSQIVGVAHSGKKDKLGISEDDKLRRRAGQAFWALAQGIRDQCADDAFITTIAAEVAGALSHHSVEAGTDFCLELAAFFDDLPSDQLQRPPGN